MKDTELKVQNTSAKEEPLDKNVRLMSPGRMVMRRFFRSKLSVLGLVLLGPDNFLAPSLALTAALLLALDAVRGKGAAA